MAGCGNPARSFQGLLPNRQFLLARLRRAFLQDSQPPVARSASLTGG